MLRDIPTHPFAFPHCYESDFERLAFRMGPVLGRLYTFYDSADDSEEEDPEEGSPLAPGLN